MSIVNTLSLRQTADRDEHALCNILRTNGGFLGFDFRLFPLLDFVLVSLLHSAGFPLQVVLMKPVLAFLMLADFL